MQEITLTVEKRVKSGKGIARGLRRQGNIPGILYKGGSSLSIQLPKKELSQFINTTAGEQVMVRLEFPGGESRFALLKDYQTDPIRGELLHSDFLEVSLTEAVKVNVSLVTVGEPVGVKRDGGILQHGLREVEIECLPDKMPGHINVDVSQLEIGQALHVGDLKFAEGIKVVTDAKKLIASVTAPRAEEAAPAAAAPSAEAAEPEVVKKGKKEEEPAK